MIKRVCALESSDRVTHILSDSDDISHKNFFFTLNRRITIKTNKKMHQCGMKFKLNHHSRFKLLRIINNFWISKFDSN